MRLHHVLLTSLAVVTLAGCGHSDEPLTATGLTGSAPRPLPADMQRVLDKNLYRGATFAYRVEDLDSGEVYFDKDSSRLALVASVRKLFSTGLALEELGGDFRFRTPVHRQGVVHNGVLDGNLILVAQGDVTMGARRGPNDTIALTELDHSEANSGGNATASPQDPLAGYRDLARQVAASGISEVSGDVVIDDRLYEPFDFRHELMVNPVFVNDNLIDVEMSPGAVGQPATVVISPVSEAFAMVSTLVTVAGTGLPKVEFSGGDCFGEAACQGTVSGTLPLDGGAPITGVYPYLQTFRVTDPSSFARTVFIEELRAAGVTVSAATVAKNPSILLPPVGTLAADTRVAVLVSPRFQQYVNYIFKTSYNLGAETSLMLFGLEKGVRTHDQAMLAEAQQLSSEYGIAPSEYHFIDGSGTAASATPRAINRLLKQIAGKSTASDFRQSLTVIGSPGVLTEIKTISNDPTLVGAIGHIFAKAGTLGRLADGGEGILLETRASSGYIDSKSGRRLIFTLVVTDVGPFEEFLQSLEVFEDIDTLSAILWREL